MNFIERKKEFEKHGVSVDVLEAKYQKLHSRDELLLELALDSEALKKLFETSAEVPTVDWGDSRKYVKAFLWYAANNRPAVPATFIDDDFDEKYFENINEMLDKLEV